MEACYYGHLTMVELLKERGASWLSRDKAGLSPLHWAVDGGHIDIVQYILNDGMDVSSKVLLMRIILFEDILCLNRSMMQMGYLTGHHL